MKILHTSDWHLGQEFYSFNRMEEHTAFLNQLEAIVKEEQPDVMVVSGDIFHNSTPSNVVMKLFTDHLDAIRQACSSMQIVVTAGNHDSSSRLEINRTVWSHLGVSIVGKIEKEDDVICFAKHIITIYNKDNEKIGYVVAIPHVFPQNFPLLEANTPREERQRMFLEALQKEVEKVNTAHLPVVVMAHMAVNGCDITGHDESIGGMDFVKLEDLGIAYDYLALGHIHCPQNLGSKHARYCGTPIPVSFEERYGHSVTLVDIVAQGAEPVLRTIPIQNPWPLKVIPQEAVEFDEAINMLANFPDHEKAYLCLHVLLKDVAPVNAIERATQAIAGKQCRFCKFLWEKKNNTPNNKQETFDIEQLKTCSPLEVATRYYQDEFKQPMDDDLVAMLETIVNQVDKKEE